MPAKSKSKKKTRKDASKKLGGLSGAAAKSLRSRKSRIEAMLKANGI